MKRKWYLEEKSKTDIETRGLSCIFCCLNLKYLDDVHCWLSIWFGS